MRTEHRFILRQIKSLRLNGLLSLVLIFVALPWNLRVPGNVIAFSDHLSINSVASASTSDAKTPSQSLIATRPDGRATYYSGREQIENIQPVQHELSPLWPSMVNGQILFVTEILHLYKDHEIYFLARDSEYLYDMARWFLKEKGQAVDRLHLINVSSKSMKSSILGEYLAQNGISREALAKKTKIVLIDTGMKGSVVDAIRRAVGATETQIKSHFILSLNDTIPSSFSFLAKVIDNVDAESLSNLESEIWNYEHLPRAFDRAVDYVRVNGIIEPRESPLSGLDGEVNAQVAQKYRESLKAYLVQETFEEERLRFERVLKRYLLILQSDLSPKLKKQKIQLILQEVSSEKIWRRRLLRDVLEAYIQAFRVFPGVDHVDFGLEKDFMVEFPKPQQTLSNGPTCPKVFGF